MNHENKMLRQEEWDFSGIVAAELEHAARYEFAREAYNHSEIGFTAVARERKQHLKLGKKERPKMPLYLGLDFVRFSDNSYLIDGNYFPDEPWKRIPKREKYLLIKKQFELSADYCVVLWEVPSKETTKERLLEQYGKLSFCCPNSDTTHRYTLFIGSVDLDFSDQELADAFVEQLKRLRRGRSGPKRRRRSPWIAHLQALAAYRVSKSVKPTEKAMKWTEKNLKHRQPLYQHPSEWTRAKQSVVRILEGIKNPWNLHI